MLGIQNLLDVDTDYEEGDYLKCGEAHTDKELLKMYHKRLLRLRSLYLEQFHVIERDLKRSYRKCLLSEKQYGPRGAFLRQMRKDSAMSKKYLSLLTEEYHSITQNIESREILPLCQSQNGKCLKKCLPMAKYCLRHIANDREQLLYKKCSSSASCDVAVLNTSQHLCCPFHNICDVLQSDLVCDSDAFKRGDA